VLLLSFSFCLFNSFLVIFYTDIFHVFWFSLLSLQRPLVSVLLDNRYQCVSKPVLFSHATNVPVLYNGQIPPIVFPLTVKESEPPCNTIYLGFPKDSTLHKTYSSNRFAQHMQPHYRQKTHHATKSSVVLDRMMRVSHPMRR